MVCGYLCCRYPLISALIYEECGLVAHVNSPGIHLLESERYVLVRFQAEIWY
jgi:hypothetical protein